MVSREPPKLRPPAPLTPEQIDKLSNNAFLRILKLKCDDDDDAIYDAVDKQAYGVKISGGSDVRIALLVKLISARDTSDEIVTQVLDYIADRFPARQALVTAWLYQEFVNAQRFRVRPHKRARLSEEKEEKDEEPQNKNEGEKEKEEEEEPQVVIKQEPRDDDAQPEQMDTSADTPKDAKGKEKADKVEEDDDEEEVESAEEVLNRYNYVFTEILRRLKDRLSAAGDATTANGESDAPPPATAAPSTPSREEGVLGTFFSKMLLDAPVIPTAGFQVVQDYCQDPRRFAMPHSLLVQFLIRPILSTGFNWD